MAMDWRQVVNVRDPLPLYAQLERGIRLAVASGAIGAGQQLPTVRELAVRLSINANTVARVYAELERQGVLITRRGRGTFAAAPNPASAAGHRDADLRHFAERALADAVSLGFAPQQLLNQLQLIIQ